MPRKTLDIESIQQINLFTKITGVRAMNCFDYANYKIFVVDGSKVNKAMGEKYSNIKKLGAFLKKKIKIIKSPNPDLPGEMEKFIKNIVYPLHFKSLKNDNGNITITAGAQSKASLIGRDHSKINQLLDIVKQYFNVKTIRVV